MEQPKRKLLDMVRDKMRLKHYSLSTERTYVHWIKHYIFFHNKKHPLEMEKPEIEQFLTSLAVQKKVSPTTQNQAFVALKAGVHKRVTSHIFRHSYATHLLQSGVDLRSIQELVGHKSVETTMVYRYVVAEMNRGRVVSPLDR